MDCDKNWYTLNDYVTATGKSISTVRRLIKSRKVQFKMDSGKYYIFDTKLKNKKKIDYRTQQYDGMMEKFNSLEKKLVSKQDEIDELKMLVNLYEKQNKQSLPELPVN